jgi:hypothetical protein
MIGPILDQPAGLHVGIQDELCEVVDGAVGDSGISDALQDFFCRVPRQVPLDQIPEPHAVFKPEIVGLEPRILRQVGSVKRLAEGLPVAVVGAAAEHVAVLGFREYRTIRSDTRESADASIGTSILFPPPPPGVFS